MAKRGPKGPTSTSFKKGICYNPGGKPKNLPTVEARKIVADLKELARQYTAEALERIVGIMRNDAAPPAAVLAAAIHVLDRGHGKPRETVENKVEVTIEDLIRHAAQRRVELANEAEAGDKLH